MSQEQTTNRDLFERDLSINIGFLAINLKSAGFKTKDLDRIGDECLKFIQNKAEIIAKERPLEAVNVENLIIMLLMHGCLTSQIKFIRNTAERLQVSQKRIENEMIKDTINGYKYIE